MQTRREARDNSSAGHGVVADDVTADWAAGAANGLQLNSTAVGLTR